MNLVDGAEHGRHSARYVSALRRDLGKAGIATGRDGATATPSLVVYPAPDPSVSIARLVDGRRSAALVVRAKPALAGDDAVERIRRLSGQAAH